MSKAQKAKQRQAEKRLEAMRAAGMVPMNETGEKAKKIVYDNKKKGKDMTKGLRQSSESVEEKPKEEPAKEEPKEEEKAAVEVHKEEPKEEEDNDWEDKADESSRDEWDADSDSDTNDKFGDLTARLEKVTTNDDDVDLIELEKKKEQERLKCTPDIAISKSTENQSTL